MEKPLPLIITHQGAHDGGVPVLVPVRASPVPSVVRRRRFSRPPTRFSRSIARLAAAELPLNECI